MQFTFNMGQGNVGLNQISQICKEHFACENCPVLAQGGLHDNKSVVMCHKVIIKLMKEKQNVNS